VKFPRAVRFRHEDLQRVIERRRRGGDAGEKRVKQ
jgi:hypothetical protein